MSLPWFRWFPSDFAGDIKVRLMRFEARAAYRELLDVAWELGPLPDPAAILRALGIPEELWEEVRGCWQQTEAGWINSRLEEEREQSETRHARASKASAAASRKKAAPREEPKVHLEASPRSTLSASQGSPCGEPKVHLEAGSRSTLSAPNSEPRTQTLSAAVYQQQLCARGDPPALSEPLAAAAGGTFSLGGSRRQEALA